MRRCTTVPGFGACCRAAQAGALNRPIPIMNGRRCGECTVIQRTKNKGPGFRFRFHKNAECGIGPSGCPALLQGGGGPGGGGQPLLGF